MRKRLQKNKRLSKKFLVQIKKQENSLLCEFSCFFIKIIWKAPQKYVSC
jgi:hypothetical protein